MRANAQSMLGWTFRSASREGLDMIRIIMDGQFGSCGKGAFISNRAAVERPTAVVRVGGPQAGHSMLGPCWTPACEQVHVGKKLMGITPPDAIAPFTHIWKMRQIPCAWHIPDTFCVIGRGAMVDLDVLQEEVLTIREALEGVPSLVVDPQATIVLPFHRKLEREQGNKFGSTFEGVGAARADLVRRKAMSLEEWSRLAGPSADWLRPFFVDNTNLWLKSLLKAGGDIWIEGTQGFGLSLRASGFYPHTTSWDITPQQLLADVGLHWEDAEVRTTMLLRTFPIRIAGESGPLEGEITWESLEITPERTTVTDKIRRVGRFDPAQVRRAIAECRPSELVITFMDYLQESDRRPFIRAVEELGVKVEWVSLGFEDIRPAASID